MWTRLMMVMWVAVMLSVVGCEGDGQGLSAPSVDTPGFLVTSGMLREKGYEAMNKGDWVTARQYFAQAVDKDPKDALAQYYLGLAELRLDQPMRAQFALEKALELQRNNPRLAPRINDRLAEALYLQNRTESLAAFLEQTVEYYGTTTDRLRQAEYLAKIGDVDNAKLAYQKAAYFADPDDPKPYLAIADFYNGLNDEPNAIQALRYALYVDPKSTTAAERLRQHGIVPGPTQQAKPPKPEMLETIELPAIRID